MAMTLIAVEGCSARRSGCSIVQKALCCVRLATDTRPLDKGRRRRRHEPHVRLLGEAR